MPSPHRITDNPISLAGETLKGSSDATNSHIGAVKGETLATESSRLAGLTGLKLESDRSLADLARLLQDSSRAETGVLKQELLSLSDPDTSVVRIRWRESFSANGDLVYDHSKASLSHAFVREVLEMHAALTLGLPEAPSPQALDATQRLLYRIGQSLQASAFAFQHSACCPSISHDLLSLAIQDHRSPLIARIADLEENILAENDPIYAAHQDLFMALIEAGAYRLAAVRAAPKDLLIESEKTMRKLGAAFSTLLPIVSERSFFEDKFHLPLVQLLSDLHFSIFRVDTKVSSLIVTALTDESSTPRARAALNATCRMFEELPSAIARYDDMPSDPILRNALQEMEEGLKELTALWVPPLQSACAALRVLRDLRHR